MKKKTAGQIQDTIYSLAVALKRMAQGVLDFGTANAQAHRRQEGRKRMKSTLKVSAAFAVLCSVLFAVGCDDTTLIEVRVVHQTTPDQYNGGMHEKFPHIVVERTDTGERIMMSKYTLGTTGDVFTVKHRDLRW